MVSGSACCFVNLQLSERGSIEKDLGYVVLMFRSKHHLRRGHLRGATQPEKESNIQKEVVKVPKYCCLRIVAQHEPEYQVCQGDGEAARVCTKEQQEHNKLLSGRTALVILPKVAPLIPGTMLKDHGDPARTYTALTQSFLAFRQRYGTIMCCMTSYMNITTGTS